MGKSWNVYRSHLGVRQIMGTLQKTWNKKCCYQFDSSTLQNHSNRRITGVLPESHFASGVGDFFNKPGRSEQLFAHFIQPFHRQAQALQHLSPGLGLLRFSQGRRLALSGI